MDMRIELSVWSNFADKIKTELQIVFAVVFPTCTCKNRNIIQTHMQTVCICNCVFYLSCTKPAKTIGYLHNPSCLIASRVGWVRTQDPTLSTAFVQWGPTRRLTNILYCDPFKKNDIDIPLVECACKQGRAVRPLLEYTREIASTIQCNSWCYMIGLPECGLAQNTNSWSLFLNPPVLSR